MTTKIMLTSALITVLLLAPIAIAEQSFIQDYVAGKMPTVKGKITLTSTDPKARINPDRPIRQLTYAYNPRLAYREGKMDSYSLFREARETTRPSTAPKDIQIKSTAKGQFTKTAPAMFPGPTASGLRSTIKTNVVTRTEKLKIKTQSKNESTKEGETQ